MTLIQSAGIHTSDCQTIGRYRLLQLVAQGGMGEVYRAFDTQMGRYVALKRMRENLLSSEIAKQRFLHEAKLTATLNHPSIVPIFEIDQEGDRVYYTMPFIQGATLKESLRQMKQRREDLHIMACARIFTSVCQAVAHAHASGILHRDLKAENIMLGQHEQVLILDWGLACWKGARSPSDELALVQDDPPLDRNFETTTRQTNPGRVVGTLAYLAPERLEGAITERSDIYSLGVLLYLMLTYQLPFQRKSLRAFRKTPQDAPPDPRMAAPHRDIPEMLVRIIQRALQPSPERRYENAQQLVADLQTFLEGRSSWYLLTQFDVCNVGHWDVQEHVFVDRWPVEISLVQPCWVYWMISKPTHSGNFRIDFTFSMGRDAEGVGLLFNIPDVHEQLQPLSGFCLWISGPDKGGACLCRDGSALLDAPSILPKAGQQHTLRVEKLDNCLYCSFDAVPALTYASTLPLVGTHVGLLSAGGATEIKALNFFAGGISLKTSCLTVPDHFLAAKVYSKALAEYRRIAFVFSGYSEGQRARFLAGITLLELAKERAPKRGRNLYFEKALEEFQMLRNSPSAPLEWLGKALTYRQWQQWAEEANCLELGCLRYPNNPKKKHLKEEIVSQLFTAVGKNRHLAARLILLLARTLPEDLLRSDILAQVQSLRAQLDTPAHFPELPADLRMERPHEYRWQLTLEMSTWLCLPGALLDSAAMLGDFEPNRVSEICASLRFMGLSRAKITEMILHAAGKKATSAETLTHESQLYLSLLGQGDLAKASSLIGNHFLSCHTYCQRAQRALYFATLQALRAANFQMASTLVELTRQHFDVSSTWQWVEVRGLILLSQGKSKALFDVLQSSADLCELQQENNPLFPLFASGALLDDRGVGHALWSCAQFASKISVRLAANCIATLQLPERRAQREDLHFKARELSHRAFALERARVYRLLAALCTGLGKPLSPFAYLNRR